MFDYFVFFIIVIIFHPTIVLGSGKTPATPPISNTHRVIYKNYENTIKFNDLFFSHCIEAWSHIGGSNMILKSTC